MSIFSINTKRKEIKVKRFLAFTLVFVMCISLLPATVVQASGEGESEYVISLAAFNTGNMKTSLTTYKTTPVLRKNVGGLYYEDAMHWDYEVAANYAADGVAFKAMNLDATAPWALEGYKAAEDPSKLGESNFELSFDSSTFGTDEPAYAAFRIKVETAGTYDLQANAVASASAAVPAVYFAKAGTDEEELLGYYDIPESDGYTKLGTVEVEAGEYIRVDTRVGEYMERVKG